MVFSILCLLIFIIYSNTFDAAWHFDDFSNIIHSPEMHICNLNLESFYNVFFFYPDRHRSVHRPISRITLALNWYWGQDQVFGYHLINTMVHCITAYLLYLTVLQLFRSPRMSNYDPANSHFISLLTAVLWAANPVQTQAVTYIVQRMTTMAAMFYLGGLYCYFKGRISSDRTRRVLFFSGCALSFLLALLSKENALTFPVALVLVEFLFFQDLSNHRVRKRFYLTGIIFGVAIIALGVIILVLMNRVTFVDLNQFYADRFFTPGERLMTQARVVVFYLAQLFYPMPHLLSIEHDMMISKSLLVPWTTLVSIIIIGLMIGVSVSLVKKRPLLAFGLLFFFLNHAIESTILPLELIFEHRNYLPSAFLFLPAAAGLKYTLDYYNKSKPSMYIIFGAFICLWIIGIGSATYIRNEVWHTEQTLWDDALRKAPGSSRPHHNQGSLYQQRGEYEKALQYYAQALTRKSHLRTDSAMTLHGIASIHFKRGAFLDADQTYREIIKVKPNDTKAPLGLVTTLIKRGKFNDALTHLTRFHNQAPQNAEFINLIGFLYLKQAMPEKAIPYFRQSLKLNPEGYDFKLNLGVALGLLGHNEKARLYLQQAFSQQSRDPVILLSLIQNSIEAGRMNDLDGDLERLLEVLTANQVIEALQNLTADKRVVPLAYDTLIPLILQKIDSLAES